MHKAVIVFSWFVACLNGGMGLYFLLWKDEPEGLISLAIGFILIYQLSTLKWLR